MGFLQSSFQIRERLEARLFELGNPALVNFLQRYRIEEVQLFAAAPHGGDQVRRLQQIEVLRHALPRHVQVFAQLVECAAVVRMQQVQELAPAGIGEGLEQHVGVVALWHVLHTSDYLPKYRQVVTCMSSARHPTASRRRRPELWSGRRSENGAYRDGGAGSKRGPNRTSARSEEHTSELQ